MLPKNTVELFHLLFLEQLTLKLDSSLYALKGGCNLRFFFNSIRYSEDIDFDVHKIAVETLKNKVERILRSAPFEKILAARGLEIISTTMPKQSTTTQRWKLAIRASNIAVPLPTKIEFSRRREILQAEYSLINSSIIREYKLNPLLISHYNTKNAFEQKILALIGRNETQARDVFDLFWLMNQATLTTTDQNIIKKIDIAISNAFTINFEQFHNQVITYLPPHEATQYNNEKIWNDIVLQVTKLLETIKK